MQIGLAVPWIMNASWIESLARLTAARSPVSAASRRHRIAEFQKPPCLFFGRGGNPSCRHRPGAAMIRDRLPNRRGHELLSFEHGGFRYTAGIGRFADGRLAELFLDCRRAAPRLTSAPGMLRLWLRSHFSTGWHRRPFAMRSCAILTAARPVRWVPCSTCSPEPRPIPARKFLPDRAAVTRK